MKTYNANETSIQYKYTCLKDIPQCKKGDSFLVRYKESNKYDFGYGLNNKIHIEEVINYLDDEKYFSKERYTDEAIDIKCKSCGDTVFDFEYFKSQKRNGDVTYFYVNIVSICKTCGYKRVICKANSNHKVNW